MTRHLTARLASLGASSEFAQWLLQEQSVALLLDGLDEIAAEHKAALAELQTRGEGRSGAARVGRRGRR